MVRGADGLGGAARRALAVIAVCASACNPIYAPPVRGAAYGAPSRLQGGRVEIGGAAIGPASPWAGGPHVAVGVDDALSVEAGGNFSAHGGAWALGWLGVRLTRTPEDTIDFVGDLELGGGAGVGGANGESAVPWNERGAGGGYVGLGAGVHAEDGALYLRGRLEVSAADRLPVTLWWTALLGLDVTIERVLALGFAMGFAGYHNDLDSAAGFVWQAQTAVLFDLPAAPPADRDPPLAQVAGLDRRGAR